jgi:hypothetical protein
MRKRTKVLITITTLWALIALIDFVAVNLIGHPILCLPVPGGEAVLFIGLGYFILMLFPFGLIEEVSVSIRYNYWPCIIGIAILVFIIMICRANEKNRDSEKID